MAKSLQKVFRILQNYREISLRIKGRESMLKIILNTITFGVIILKNLIG